jgi:Zn-dependent protease
VLGLSITPEKLIVILFFLGIGFPVHEFAHAFAAYRLGDGTAKVFGRLTLNPVKHFDPVGGVLFVASALLGAGFVIGWAKPTPVNPSNLRDRRNGEVVVALAGPGSNLIMASVAALVFRAAVAFWPDAPLLVLNVLYVFVLFNVMLALFNLIPIPPLDGSTILFRFLDPATAWRLRVQLAQYGFVVILLAVFLFGPQIGYAIAQLAAFMLGLNGA